MEETIYRALRAHALTRGLTDEQVGRLVGLAHVLCYLPGAHLFRESQPRRQFGILLRGRAEVRKDRAPDVLYHLETGDSFGEGSLLDDYPHSTSGIVVAPTELVAIPRSEVERLGEEEPLLFARLAAGAARVIASRLRAANARLAGRGTMYVSGELRRERDLLGERDVPEHAYYGIQTLRAVENFPFRGAAVGDYPYLVQALASVKQAAAEANMALGLLDRKVGRAIVRACKEIQAGRLHEEFVVGMIQGGAGTSTNMNANEVIANRALEILGRKRGMYDVVHPNNHVNLSQSTNDVYPTALRIAAIRGLRELEHAVGELRDAFLARADAFADIVKIGRTQLQDAVPMTLGQEFRAFGVTLGEDLDRIREAALLMREINMGATAIGTGINTTPDYAPLVCARLAEITRLDLVTSPDLVEATMDTGAFVQVSGVLKRVAVKLSKICNDLRLLSSGPRTGLAEIQLPAMQPGSSIMPGKVNPVIPEAVNQIAFHVIGNDVSVTLAAEAGELQLNAFEPLIAYNLFQSMGILARGCVVLRERCVAGIEPNRERIREHFERSIGVVTALVPVIGYDRASALAGEALATGRGVYELVLEKDWVTRAELDEILSPAAMTQPRPMPVLRGRLDAQDEAPPGYRKKG